MSLCLKIISAPRHRRNYCFNTQNFVPKHLPIREVDVDVLRKFILQSKKIVVLSGAGVSTESGDLLTACFTTQVFGNVSNTFEFYRQLHTM